MATGTDDDVEGHSPPFSDAFLENAGQVRRSDVRYYATAGGVTFGFARAAVLMSSATPDGAGGLIRVRFAGANPVEPEGRRESSFRTNFFLGSDSAGWRTGLRSYQEIAYPNLYDGIDLAYRLNERGAKYEFTVRPWADMSILRLSYEGVNSLRVSASGDLVLSTPLGEVRDTAPVGLTGAHEVPCRFTLFPRNSVGLSCPGRDPSQTLVVDPLIYATFLGGGDYDEARAVAVDADGNTYVAGSTRSADFPVSPGAFDTTRNDLDDVIVAKLDPTGRSVVYATYLGGAASDMALGIAVWGGFAHVTGQTDSPDFPTTAGAMDRQGNSTDGFVVKLSAAGDALVYSTFLGGGSVDVGYSVEVDASGNAYLTGITGSVDFPTTPGAMNTSFNGGILDLFLVKLNTDGSALAFGTYFGGSQPLGNLEIASDLAVDGDGSAFVVGITTSVDFPTTVGAFSRTLNGPTDAFVTKFAPGGGSLLYSTYLGGSSGESATTVAIDTGGCAYVAGFTDSFDFPATPGAFDTSYGGTTDAYVAKVLPAGSGLSYASFLGGPNEDVATGVGVDMAGRVTVGGYTNSTGFPTTPGASNPTFQGGVYDGYLIRLNASGARLVYGTFIGGGNTDIPYALALDAAGTAYMTGITNSTDFPVTAGSYNETFSGGLFDAFVAKASLAFPLVLQTSPSGLQVDVGGVLHSTPHAELCDPEGTVTVGSPSPQVASGAQWTFVSWSDGGPQSHSIACTQPTTITATFVATEYETVVDTAPASLSVVVDGVVRGAPHAFWCVAGSAHTVDAPTPQVAGSVRYTFASWSDGGPKFHEIPCSAPALFAATFASEYGIAVTTSPANRRIVVDGSALTAPQWFWWPQGSAHTIDAPSPQTVGSTRFLYLSWSDGGPQSHTVTISSPSTFVANFTTEHEILVDTSPLGLQVRIDGNPFSAPAGFWCVEGTSFEIGTPSPQGGVSGIRYAYLSWSDGGGQNHTVGCTGPASHRASFATEFETRFDTSPPALDFEFDATPYAAPLTFWCQEGSVHTLGAPSPQGSGPVRHTFKAWSDNGAQSHGLRCDGPRTYTATFAIEYEVVVATSPSGLLVAVDGMTVTGPTTFWWTPGSVHSLSVPSPQGIDTTRHQWTSWSDGGTQDHAVLVNAPATFTASFVEEYLVLLETSPPSLAITVDGTTHPTPEFLWLRGYHTFEARTPQFGAVGVRYAFIDWNDSNVRLRTVEVTTPLTLHANFVTQFFLRATSPHETPSCDRPDCWYDAGRSATLRIEPSVDGISGVRFRFAQWTGDATGLTPAILVLMEEPKSVTAEWTTEYFLRVVSAVANVEGEGWYPDGTRAHFRVTTGEVAADGKRYRFVRWTGDFVGGAEEGALMMDRPKQVAAGWEELSPIGVIWWWPLPLLVAVVLILVFWARRRRPGDREHKGRF